MWIPPLANRMRTQLLTAYCYPPWHQDVCAAHKIPKVNGQPFDATATAKELEAAGLVKMHAKLKNHQNPGFKPPGQPKQVGGKLVFPHFQ